MGSFNNYKMPPPPRKKPPRRPGVQPQQTHATSNSAQQGADQDAAQAALYNQDEGSGAASGAAQDAAQAALYGQNTQTLQEQTRTRNQQMAQDLLRSKKQQETSDRNRAIGQQNTHDLTQGKGTPWSAENKTRVSEQAKANAKYVDNMWNPGAAKEAPGATAPSSSLFDDMMAAQSEGWDKTQQLINSSAAGQQRRNANINAAMGRSVGGGFGAATAQTQLGLSDSLARAKQGDINQRLGIMSQQAGFQHQKDILDSQQAHELDINAANTPETPVPGQDAFDEWIGTLSTKQQVKAGEEEQRLLAEDPNMTPAEMMRRMKEGGFGDPHTEGGTDYTTVDDVMEKHWGSGGTSNEDNAVRDQQKKDYEKWMAEIVAAMTTHIKNEGGTITSDDIERIQSWSWKRLRDSDDPHQSEAGPDEIMAALPGLGLDK